MFNNIRVPDFSQVFLYTILVEQKGVQYVYGLVIGVKTQNSLLSMTPARQLKHLMKQNLLFYVAPVN